MGSYVVALSILAKPQTSAGCQGGLIVKCRRKSGGGRNTAHRVNICVCTVRRSGKRALTGRKNNGAAAGIDQKKSGLNSESHILLIVRSSQSSGGWRWPSNESERE